MRRATVGLVLATFVCAGSCEGGAKSLSCGDSVAWYCATYGGCVLTWDEAQSDTSFCGRVGPMTIPSRADCGVYHAVTVGFPDAYRTYYYDGASGMLVAVVVASGFTNSTTCAAGPAAFMLPTCRGAGSEPLSQCLDGGADASPVSDGAPD